MFITIRHPFSKFSFFAHRKSPGPLSKDKRNPLTAPRSLDFNLFKLMLNHLTLRQIKVSGSDLNNKPRIEIDLFGIFCRQ